MLYWAAFEDKDALAWLTRGSLVGDRVAAIRCFGFAKP